MQGPPSVLTLGIDASRNRSGGAKAHLIGILSEVDPTRSGIGAVHVWAFKSLLDAIPDRPWLVKHNPSALEKGLPAQLWWQATGLIREAREVGCDILFTTDASTVCRFQPMVVLSQDMLSYEPNVMQSFGHGYSRARLIAILYLQNWVFRRAQGVIFLTRYAATAIQQSCGLLPNITHIPHGVGAAFQALEAAHTWPPVAGRAVRCLYISNTAPYKHQWHVVRAVAQLRQRGYALQLELVGGGEGKAQTRLEAQIALSDPGREFVTQREFVPQQTLPGLLEAADLFVFASSCENMPNTLVEAMAAGLPIASSNRGPMPEVLEDGGVFFDPEDPNSIAAAIEDLITNSGKRTRLAARAKELSRQYSWARCARETFSFIAQTAKRITQSGQR